MRSKRFLKLRSVANLLSLRLAAIGELQLGVSVDSQARQASDFIEVPKADLPFVTGSSSIGAAPNNIQALQESTKTHIHVSRDGDPCKISIIGEKSGVQSAKDKIQAILNEVSRSYRHIMWARYGKESFIGKARLVYVLSEFRRNGVQRGVKFR